MIVAFTGHRPDKLGNWNPTHPVVDRVRSTIRAALETYRPLYAISGMALGVDQWAAEICLELGVPFVAALPCDAMDAMWQSLYRLRLRELLKKAAEVVVVSPGPYAAWKMQKRNEWMVDHCNKLLAVHDGSRGGTWNCLAYAAQVKRDVERLQWQ